jgi:hypothetical protein
MTFVWGFIAGAMSVIVVIWIWYISGEDLMTGILSDDEAMWNAGKTEKMGSSQKTEDS